MTISNTSIKNVYSGNGVATVFAFTFPIAAETELEVYLLESGFLVLKTLTTDYTISGVGNPSGGSVTFVTPPPTVTGGSDIVLVRKTPLTQLADYIEGDSFPAETHEAALDKLTKIAQEHAEALDRAAQLPINSSEDVETLTQAILLVADNSTNINTVAANVADINTVATDIANVNAVAANEADINTVATDIANVNAVAANVADINTVATDIANVNAVAANEANINAAVADLPSLSAKVSKAGDAMSGLLQLDQSSDIVAAATTDLGTATGNAVTVTHASGTLAITSFGGASLQSGTELTITWSVSGGSLSATYNATSLILPSAANLTIADGDVWRVQKIDDASAYWRVTNIEKAAGGLRLINRRVITASETGTAYTAGARKAKVIICGGGGGGGGAAGVNPGSAIAFSGHGGAYSEKFFDITEPDYDITIGAAGDGGAAGENNGTAGGTTTFTDGTNTLTANGGGAGSGVTGTNGNSPASAEGSAATASGGDINLMGGVASARGRISGLPVALSMSGCAPFFGGGKVVSGGVTNQNGPAGTNYGEGGAGAFVRDSNVTRAGGNGFQGVCILEEYA
jgi:hypothetical protein